MTDKYSWEFINDAKTVSNEASEKRKKDFKEHENQALCLAAATNLQLFVCSAETGK